MGVICPYKSDRKPGGALHSMRAQRAVFHRSVSAQLFVAARDTLAAAAGAIVVPAWLSGSAQSVIVAREPVVCCSDGNGKVRHVKDTNCVSQKTDRTHRANKMDSTVPWILCAVSAPVMLFKQYVNVVQIVQASRWLAEGDQAERARLGFPKKTR